MNQADRITTPYPFEDSRHGGAFAERDSRLSEAAFALVRPAPVARGILGAPSRQPTRPIEHRGPDFQEKFDSDTLAYDCFRLPDGRVTLLGPSLFNLRPLIETMSVTAIPSGQACRFTIRHLDRHTRIVVDAPPDADQLVLHLETGSATIAIEPGLTDVFAGRRVLFTLSKNNHLNWIRDWIGFARDHHGADAVLLYDNASTLYRPEDLLETISGIEGIATARIVDWRFKYGPQGVLGRLWDSDFCQHGAWEHARWRFLAKASSAQNADVDELVVSANGRSVFDAAEADPFGIVSYRGRWVVGTSQTRMDAASGERAHSDYDTVLRVKRARKFGVLPTDSAACPPKWTIVPGKCPPWAQWGVHAVFGWLPSRRVSRNFSYRHFREISDNWKYARTDRPDFDAGLHEHDVLLAAHFARQRR